MTATEQAPPSFSSRKVSRWLWLLFLAGVLAAGWWAWDLRTARYRGHTAAWWFRRPEIDPMTEEDVPTAFRAMGKPAVPFLISQLQARPSKLLGALDSIAIRFKPREPYERRLLFRQQRASQLLGEIGPPARAAIPSLEVAASNSMWFVWTAAKAALIKIRGDPFTPYIQLLSDRSNCLTWYPNAMLLGELGTNAFAAVPILLESLQYTNAIIQANAIIALGMIRCTPERCVPAIIPFLTNADVALRQKAFFAVRSFKAAASPAGPEIILGLGDRDPWTKIMALQAANEVLSPTEKRKALREIEALLSDSSPYVREWAKRVVPSIQASASK
jgi:hypothetical protein